MLVLDTAWLGGASLGWCEGMEVIDGEPFFSLEVGGRCLHFCYIVKHLRQANYLLPVLEHHRVSPGLF